MLVRRYHYTPNLISNPYSTCCSAGAAHLARALREHTNDALAELDLGYNEIKDQGACAIAQVPRQCP